MARGKKYILMIAIVLLFGVTAAFAVLQGDITGDGWVDIFDYAQAVKDFGVMGSSAQDSDINEDSKVDNQDLALIIQNWGSTDGSQTDGTDGTDGSDGDGAGGIDMEDPKLIVYLSMEETSGKVIHNVKPGDLGNLKPYGTAQFGVAGKKGKGVKVNGLNNALCSGTGTDCGDDDTYDFKAGEYSMGMWVKFSSKPNGFLWRKWELEKGNYSYFLVDSQVFLGTVSHAWPDYLFGYDHANRAKQPTGRGYREAYMGYGSTGLTTNTWHHFAIVRKIKPKPLFVLYVDGEPTDSVQGTITEADGGVVKTVFAAKNQNSKDPFRLGELKGTVDEFFAYDKALTDEEVLGIYDEQQ